ncbi:MAG: MarR family transcriptional regulator [Alphaproteobacteria bacterium]|nr:MarR family transcriptional regulator [Alphaproteobacteria bacterium]
MDSKMLIEAVENSDILPQKQKRTLVVICSSEYPLSAKSIEKNLSMNKQSINYSLKSLLKRNFLIREKDGCYVYRPNYIRIEELVRRNKQSL